MRVRRCPSLHVCLDTSLPASEAVHTHAECLTKRGCRYGWLAPYTAVTTILALDDCTADNGAICVAEGSHKNGQRPADWSPLTEEETRGVVDDNGAAGDGDGDGGIITLPMCAGEVLLLHCHTVHGSKGNTTAGDRRLLFCRYADADAVEVYNEGAVRVGRLLRGVSTYKEVHPDGDDTR